MTEEEIAARDVVHGNKYPYDAPDAWWEGNGDNPPAPVDWAHSAARAVIYDLQDRRTIKRGFENIDEDIRAELVAKLAMIIRAAAILEAGGSHDG